MTATHARIMCLWFLSLTVCATAALAQPPNPHATRWAIAIHGGAGEEEWQHMDAATAAAYRASLARALDAGAAVLVGPGQL